MNNKNYHRKCHHGTAIIHTIHTQILDNAQVWIKPLTKHIWLSLHDWRFMCVCMTWIKKIILNFQLFLYSCVGKIFSYITGIIHHSNKCCIFIPLMWRGGNTCFNRSYIILFISNYFLKSCYFIKFIYTSGINIDFCIAYIKGRLTGKRI